jgi:hypothetical protein
MSLEKRLKGYANPQKGPHGAGRDQANIDYWSDRATENSKIAPRASDGPMRLTSGKVMNTRDTGMQPYRSRNVDARMKALDDMDVAGDINFMPGVRRQV